MSLSVKIEDPESHGATAAECPNYQSQKSLYVVGTRAYSSSSGYGSRKITVTADKAIKRVRLTKIIYPPIYDKYKSGEPIACGSGWPLSPDDISSNGDNGTSYPRVVIYNGDTREVIGDRSWYTWDNIDSDKFYVDIYNGKYTPKIIIEYRIPYCNAKSRPVVEFVKITAAVVFHLENITEEKFDFVDASISSDIAFNKVKTLHGYKCIPDKNVSISYYAESEVTPPIIFQVNIDRQVIFDKQSWGHYTYEGVINSDSFREMTAWLFVANTSPQEYYTNSDTVWTHYPIEIRSTQGRITKCKLGNSINCITEYKNAPPSNYMSPTITSVLGISNIINDYANKRYTYTVDASIYGKQLITATIEDNLDDSDKRHATDKQYIQVYQPPETKITVDDDTPDIGDTITFTNDSVEEEGSICKYDWYINQELKYSDKSKDFSLEYDVESPNKFLVSIVGYDTAEPSDTTSNAILINPNSPIPDFRVRCRTSLVYASIPATFYIEGYDSRVTYTWEVNNVPKGTGESIEYTPTDIGELTVKATATRLGITESNTYSTTVQSPAPLIAFTYSPEENIIRGFTDVTLDNKSTPVKGTTPTYTWYVNSSVVVPIDNKIKLYNETNKIKLTGTVSGFSSSYETDPIPTISPAPTLNLTLSKDSASTGDTVTCNSNIVPMSGTTVQIRWYINNVPVESYNNQDVIDYIVPDGTHSDVDIRVEAWATSSPEDTSESSKTLRIVRYKSPIDRFVVCIYNDNVKEDEFTTHKLTDQLRCFTRDSSSPDRYTNLSFETRLNETGNGSLDILIDKTTEDDTLLTSGNSIVIFDDFLPVYTGVITSVSNTNICVSGKSDIMKKEMYTIKFDEGCRKLSYIQSTKSKTIVGSLATLCNELIPEKYLGEIKSSDSTTYSFSISYQDILSQIDSLGEQYNVRYRTRPKSYGTWYGDMTFTTFNNKPIISYDKGEIGIYIPKGTLVCGYLQSQFLLARTTTNVLPEDVSHAEIQLLIPVPSSLLRKKFDGVSFFSNESIIDIKDTYYENESIFPVNEECKSDNKKALIINKTCLDVSDIDNLNKHYGSISVSSPQFNKPNKVCSMKLTVPYLKDNSIIQGWHLVNPFDYVIVDVAITDTQSLNILVKGDAKKDMETASLNDYRLYYISQDTSNDGNHSDLIPSFDKGTWEKIEKISDDGIKEVYTKLIGVPLYPPYDVNTYKNLIGKHMFSLYISMEDNHTYPRIKCENAYIGGVLIKGKKERNEDYYKLAGNGRDKYQLDYFLETTFGFSNNLLVLPQEPALGSPYLLYPNKTLSVTVQSSMSYADLAVIASNIARLGSNFTATVTGTCNINQFVDTMDLLPHVGSHVALYYDDGSAVKIGSTDYNEYYHDYELQSYKVDTQKMTVDFNFGIKPINIGDVIYRLSQNMTTNIVNK